jgi:hypothetical protein
MIKLKRELMAQSSPLTLEMLVRIELDLFNSHSIINTSVSPCRNLSQVRDAEGG